MRRIVAERSHSYYKNKSPPGRRTEGIRLETPFQLMVDVERNEKVSDLLDGYLDLASVEVTPFNGYPIQLKWDGQKFRGLDQMMEKRMRVSMVEMKCLIRAPDQSLLLK